MDATTSGREPMPSRRSARSVAKPDFKALESGDDGLDESLGLYDSDGGGSKKRRMKKSGGGSGGGGGSRHKTKKPALLEDLELNAKRLEEDIAALESEAAALERRYESLKSETRELHAGGKHNASGGSTHCLTSEVDGSAVKEERQV